MKLFRTLLYLFMSFLVRATKRNIKELDWELHETSMYKFMIDTSREIDTTRPEAAFKCKSLGGRLVTINSNEERTWLQSRIKALVEGQGQGFALEQWWTGGTRKGNGWIWPEDDHVVPISMHIDTEDFNPRVNYPNFYVSLMHDEDGWILKLIPENYRLRFICERDITPQMLPQRPTEERIMKEIFEDYDSDSRGNRRAESGVTIYVDLRLLSLHQLNEQSMTLSINAIFSMEWRDDRLSWRPSHYDNFTSLAVKPSRVWLPQLQISNSAGSPALEWPSSIPVLIHHDGSLQWQPVSDVTTSCVLNMAAFPFDVQHCSIVLGSPVYGIQKVNLTSGADEVSLSNFSQHADWDITHTGISWTEVSSDCWQLNTKCPQLTVTLTLARRSFYYVLVVLLPALMLAILSLVTFWVPIQDGSKAHMAGVVLLAYTAFIFIAMDAMPLCPLHIPILACYLGISVVLVATVLCCEVLVLNCYHNCSGRPLPDFANRFISKRYKSSLCCVPREHHHETEGTNDNSSCNSSYSKKSDESRRSSEKNSSPSSFQKALSSSLWDHKAKAILAPVGCTAEELGTLTAVDQAAGAEQLAADTRRCLVEKTSKPEKHKSREDYNQQWRCLAMVLDRIFFIIFMVLTVLNTVFGFLIPVLIQS